MNLIKRYANRKLYSTRDSKYLTLLDLTNEKDYQVICSKTKRDITKIVKLKVEFTNKLQELEKELNGEIYVSHKSSDEESML